MPAPYCYDYPRPALTVDLVAFAQRDGKDLALLVRRGRDPFAGRWALPGGFVEIDEPVDAAARREFREETGVELTADAPILFLGAWTRPGRDPRGRTISLVHVVRLEGPPPEPRAGDDANASAWLEPEQVADLAFDHAEVLRAAVDWLHTGRRPERVG